MGFCSCDNVVVTNPTCPCPIDTCKNCLIVNSTIIGENDGPGPCGRTGLVHLRNLNDYSVCDDNVRHEIISYDENGFSSVGIDPITGQLTFTTSNTAKVGRYYEIAYRVKCCEDLRSAMGVVTVGIADPCNCIDCGTGEECDSCAGECFPVGTNVSVSDK